MTENPNMIFPWSELNRLTGGMRTPGVTVVTGGPGVGKLYTAMVMANKARSVSAGVEIHKRVESTEIEAMRLLWRAVNIIRENPLHGRPHYQGAIQYGDEDKVSGEKWTFYGSRPPRLCAASWQDGDVGPRLIILHGTPVGRSASASPGRTFFDLIVQEAKNKAEANNAHVILTMGMRPPFWTPSGPAPINMRDAIEVDTVIRLEKYAPGIMGLEVVKARYGPSIKSVQGITINFELFNDFTLYRNRLLTESEVEILRRDA
jgi:hypothetical protein